MEETNEAAKQIEVPVNTLFMNINRRPHASDIYDMTLLIKLDGREVSEYDPGVGSVNQKVRYTELRLVAAAGTGYWCKKYIVNANRDDEDTIRVDLVDEVLEQVTHAEFDRNSGKIVQKSENKEESDSTQTQFETRNLELNGGENGGTSGSYEP